MFIPMKNMGTVVYFRTAVGQTAVSPSVSFDLFLVINSVSVSQQATV